MIINFADAFITIRMKYFTGNLVAPLISNYDSVTGSQALFGRFKCFGIEKTLKDCSYNTSAQCSTNQKAGVQCLGI